jgi:hypothetical protein
MLIINRILIVIIGKRIIKEYQIALPLFIYLSAYYLWILIIFYNFIVYIYYCKNCKDYLKFIKIYKK